MRHLSLGDLVFPVSLICAWRKNLPVRAATDDSVSFLTLLFRVFKSELNRMRGISDERQWNSLISTVSISLVRNTVKSR